MTEHAQRRTTEPSYVLPVLDFFARMGSAEAIVHGERRYTYAETRAAVLAMATTLTARGVRGAMTAVAVTRNHPESIILLLALHLLGCRAGFVAADAPREDQRDFIEQAGADVLIHDSGVAEELIGEAMARAERPVLGLGPAAGHPDLLAEMVVAAAGSAANGAGAGGAGADHEPQSLFHTAGTIGPPKLVRHGAQAEHRALGPGGHIADQFLRDPAVMDQDVRVCLLDEVALGLVRGVGGGETCPAAEQVQGQQQDDRFRVVAGHRHRRHVPAYPAGGQCGGHGQHGGPGLGVGVPALAVHDRLGGAHPGEEI